MRVLLIWFLIFALRGAASELPKSYTCCRVEVPPVIDGKPDEEVWENAKATDRFVDIVGAKSEERPATRVKLLWDDRYLYVGASLEEKHLWATHSERDSIIFEENDFVVLIDHDGDGCDYVEFDINAKNTVWDLFLPVPYREGAAALPGWDAKGLKHAVALDGTLNDASDEDRGWTVEMAIPWEALRHGFRRPIGHPMPGEVWRMNFARIEWPLEASTGAPGGYQKKIGENGSPQGPSYQVWSEQGIEKLHEPEFWGMVVFSSQAPGVEEAVPDGVKRLEPLRQEMFRFYREQKEYSEINGGRMAPDIVTLGEFDFEGAKTGYVAGDGQFVLRVEPNRFDRLSIDQTGRWRKK